ncbi:serine hydrolase domain-containing protein [Bacillus salacetis]|uniref:serine hydrolase domain-containing protein n=1 Tax=Bacillus salacetis TaxID=2315464 RepID=UPI001443A2FA|nr:serine hydrolase domain-containing protein [Bacillus salacetis]
MDFYNVKGLSMAYIHNGRISRQDYFGVVETGTADLVNEATIFNACSISKLLTGLLVMVLVEKGILDLDEDVNRRLLAWKVPENEFASMKKVTLRRLLSHQSGIIDPKDSFSELNSSFSYPSMIELLEGKTPYCKTAAAVSIEPGSEFQYSDTGYCIIQQLIEDATGKPFEAAAYELIFQPLRMENSSFPTNIFEEAQKHFACGHNKDGEVLNGRYSIYPYPAASGLWTTPADLAKLPIELFHSLKGKSKTGISALNAKEMIHSHGQKWTGLGVFLEGAEEELEISSLGWGIGYQSMLVGYPHLESGLVIMTNTDQGVHQLNGIIGEIYHASTF